MMANEYINKNRLLQHLADWWLTESPTGNEILFINGEPQTTPIMKVIEKFIKVVEEQPTADVVEVVHGEWIKADSMPRSAKCSECNCWITRHTITENWFRYCPHCGAKMDGKKVE